MRHPEFSEFSFGFSLTENIINGSHISGVRGAPTFPSLCDEGKSGGGYDVKIPKRGAALFLQFKIPQVVTRWSPRCPQGFLQPYYRMHLMRNKHSLQHRALLNHARGGRLVFYSSPIFHTTDDLNRFHDNREVPVNSVFVGPELIGPLTDEPHHVAYTRGAKEAWLYSEPIRLDDYVDFESFRSRLSQRVSASQSKDIDERFFKNLAEEIIGTLRITVLQAESQALELPSRQRDDFSPAWQVGYGESPEVRAEKIEARTRNHFRSLLEKYPLPAAVGYLPGQVLS